MVPSVSGLEFVSCTCGCTKDIRWSKGLFALARLGSGRGIHQVRKVWSVWVSVLSLGSLLPSLITLQGLKRKMERKHAGYIRI
ncbi:hypothetical protein CTI12_AA306670 [Artemisia annua]|uniref:Uncharacterized protein n=1 Tax=Artemisia annua TaxID=35608 RepID=A0A2U1M1N9_ARTAN|nr:hypothetical protein CTI12_AA306670 [Artemisia annua]